MIVEILLTIAGIYILCGILFVVPFLLKGIKIIDEGVHGSGWGFKLIIVPGTIVLWPFLLSKWMTAGKRQGS